MVSFWIFLLSFIPILRHFISGFLFCYCSFVFHTVSIFHANLTESRFLLTWLTGFQCFSRAFSNPGFYLVIYRIPLNDAPVNHPFPHQQFNICFCRHFLGMNLDTLNGAMSRHLQALLKAEMPHNQRDWKEEELFNLSYSFLFKYESPLPLPKHTT